MNDLARIVEQLRQRLAVLERLEYASSGSGPPIGPHDILSDTHDDSTPATAQRGDLIIAQGDAPATWRRLGIGATPGHVFTTDGTDGEWAAPPPETFTAADHAAIGNGAPHHAPVTLDANADTVLSLSVQQLGLDTQAANHVWAGPTSGAAAVPTFRALVLADLPIDRIYRMGATWATYERTAAGLTAALAAAVAGDTVWVPPGTYAGDFTIPDGVLLRGASRDGCFIDGTVVMGCTTRLYSFSIVKVYDDDQDRYAIIFTGGAPGYVREVYIQLEQTGSGSSTGILIPVAQTVYVKDCFIECLGFRGFAVRIDHDISGGAPLAVIDKLDGDAPVPAETRYFDEDIVVAPPNLGLFVYARLNWEVRVTAQSADWSYFWLDFRAFVNAQECHPADYPISTILKIRPRNTGVNSYIETFLGGAWVTGNQDVGIEDRDANCGIQEYEDGLLFRMRRQSVIDLHIRFFLDARMGIANGNGIGRTELEWLEERFGGGVYLDDNYLFGVEADIAAEKARVYVQGNTYRPEFVVLTDSDLIPEPGDRSAWDVDDYPDEHASDIASATPLYHWLEADIENVADAQIAVHAAVVDAHQNRLHDVEDVLDHETFRTDTSLVLKPDGAGAVEFAAIAVGDLPNHAATHQHGGVDEVATATPVANDIPKLNAGGDLALPAGGDVLPEGETLVARGINNGLELVSGPRGTRDYGYNPWQRITPESWALGVDDGSARDDFFRVNDGAGGTPAIWSAVVGCTPYDWRLSAFIPSLLFLQSGHAADAVGVRNHAIIQAAVTGHASGDRYSAHAQIGNSADRDFRAGLVLMRADLLLGAAMWIVYTTATATARLEAATYSSSDAWLSQGNAKTSSVGYTTDWTVRWAGAEVPADEYVRYTPPLLQIRPFTDRLILTVRGTLGSAFNVFDLFSSAVAFTPATLFLFVEGNVASTSFRPVLNTDFAGRLALV